MKIRFRKNGIILVLISALSLAGYLLWSAHFFKPGFPLDDAWIHQTYAQNLAQLREWSFIPGQPSAGSTSPLWTLLLALGHAVGLGPYVWTYALGWLCLMGLGLAGWKTFTYLSAVSEKWAFAAGVLLTLEWHLVWAAGSGMETALFSLVVTLVIGVMLPTMSKRSVAGWAWSGLGALIGLSVWVRPDGLTLLAPLGFVIFLRADSWTSKIKNALYAGVGFAFAFLPYLIYNNALAGAWWPNTFYAKQAEYDFVRQSVPLWQRLLDQAVLPLVGVGALLLPGFVLKAWQSLRQRHWGALATVLWGAGYLGLYAWRLPVTYQHGRYVIPMMPIFFLWGFAGMVEAVRPNAAQMWVRVISKGWAATSALILVSFWFLGGRSYALDVAIIESEMVTIAHWIAENTPEDALIATHDIGALGYFSERRLVDLAGLISPEVIPHLWDEAHLEEYLNRQGVDYLVSFPGWFPNLTGRATPVFSSESPYSLMLDHENMAVYRWEIP